MQGTRPSFNVYRAKVIVASVLCDGVHRKLFQIIFAQNDHSIYVNFPYFRLTDGLAVEFTIPAGSLSTEIRFGDHAHLTSHLVKYSHHRDGKAHFSQDGKVVNKVGRQSVPLDTSPFHMFTSNLVGLEHFAPGAAANTSSVSPRREYVSFGEVRGKPAALKFIGIWTTGAHIVAENPHLDPGNHGPMLVGIDSLGRPGRHALLSPPVDHAFSDRILQIRCAIGDFQYDDSPILTFIGGFDRQDVSHDLTKATRGLAFQYPASDLDDLRIRLPTLDYVSKP